MRQVLLALLLAIPVFAETEFALPADVYPVALAAESDGTLWYASPYSEIGRILPNGELERVDIPSFYIEDATVVLLPEGGVAVGDANGLIAKVDRRMQVTIVDVRRREIGESWVEISDVLLGADGNLWFGGYSPVAPFLGRLSPDGAIARFPLPDRPGALALSPSNGFFVASVGSIHHVTTDGQVTRVATCASWCSHRWIEVAADGSLWSAAGRLEPNGSFIPNSLGGRDAARGPDGNVWIAPDTNALRAYAPDGTLAREVPFRTANESPLSIASHGDVMWYGVRGAIRGFHLDTPVDLRLRAGDIVTIDEEQNCCFEGTHRVLAFHRRGARPFLRRIERAPGWGYEGGGIFAVGPSRILLEESDYSDTVERPIAAVLDGEGLPRGILAGPQDTRGAGIVVDREGRAHALREGFGRGGFRLLTYSAGGTLLRDAALPLPNEEVEAIDLASDQCTLYYVGPPMRVGRFDICTGAVLPDLAADLPGRGRDLRVFPDGDVVVVFRTRLVRYTRDGAIAREYAAPEGDELWSVALDLDPSYVWLGASALVRMNLATGAFVEQVPVYGQPWRISVVGEPRAARTPARRRASRHGGIRSANATDFDPSPVRLQSPSDWK